MRYMGFKKGDYVVVESGITHVMFKSGDLLRIDEEVHDPVPGCVRVSDGMRGVVSIKKLRPAKPHEIPQPSDWDRFLDGKIALTVKKAEWEAFALALEKAGLGKWRGGGTVHKDSRTNENYPLGVRIFGRSDGLSYWSGSCPLPVRAFADIYIDDRNQKVIITTDGRVTTAKLLEGKRVMHEAKATCAPNDTFSFKEGATIAFDRLFNGKSSRLIDTDVIADELTTAQQALARIAQEVSGG